MAEISYVNTVNVNLTGTPQGMTDFVVANICLFSNEKAKFVDEYKVYVSPSAVADDFGSDSVTYAMANAIFAQTPNLRSGGGSLIVAPYKATNATFATIETSDLSGVIKTIQTLTNGTLTIKDAENIIALTDLNFTSVTSVEDIAKVIKNKAKDLTVEYVKENNSIIFKSHYLGEESKLTVVATDESTDIAGLQYLNIIDTTSNVGANAIDTEKLSDAVNRVASKIFFGGVLDTTLRENDSIEANVKIIEGMSKKIYVEAIHSLNNIKELGQTIKTGGYKKTKLLAYASGSYKDVKCFASAYLSKALCTNYTGSNTCITMNLKELATINPDTSCSDNELVLAKQYGVDIYGSTSGLACVYSTRNAGGYMDDITGIASFTGELEVAGFNYLRQTNTKVPQTEAGMTGLKDYLAQVCERYVTNGFIGTGLKWNSAEKFGDVEDFDRNIFEKGYYIYSLPIAQQKQSERESRIAPLIQIACKSAGAIHVVNVNGTIEA